MNSQFTIYSSSDPSGPGLITGLTGFLITVLDACLVNGYTGKPAAGWTKPLGQTGSLTAYHQPSGSGLNMFVNDMGGNVPAAGKEAWAVGWETITSLTSSTTLSITGSIGAGFGQFPTPTLLSPAAGGTGTVVWRKSASADAVGRYWMIAADAYTFYMWISTGDVANTYTHFSFGDIFSFAGTADTYRCHILGRTVVNTAVGNAVNQEYSDVINYVRYTSTQGGVITPFVGLYMARTLYGGGQSIILNRRGDCSVAGGFANFTNAVCSLNGSIQTPNGSDNSFYLVPLTVGEPGNLMIRGRWRGLYQLCHSATLFSDGQTFSGANDYAGKSFKIIKQGPTSGLTGGFSGADMISMWVIETSPTIETN